MATNIPTQSDPDCQLNGQSVVEKKDDGPTEAGENTGGDSVGNSVIDVGADVNNNLLVPDEGPNKDLVPVGGKDKRSKPQKKPEKKPRTEKVPKNNQYLKLSEDNLISEDSDYDSGDDLTLSHSFSRRTTMCHRDRGSHQMMRLNSRICPWDNVPLYITHVDKMLALDDSMEEKRKEFQDNLTAFFKDFRRPCPAFTLDDSMGQNKKLYDVATDAYKIIRTKIKNKPNHADEYDNLVAALEIAGMIILMPGLLNMAQRNYRTSTYSLHLDSFASKWTRNKVSKVIWPSEKPGLQFHFVKKSVIRIF